LNSQDNIESNLERVQTALAITAMRSLNIHGEWLGDTNHLRKALTASQRLHWALLNYNRSGSDAQFGKARDYCSDMRVAVSELNPEALLPVDCFFNRPCQLTSSPRTACWLGALKDVIKLQPGDLDSSGSHAATVARLASQLRSQSQFLIKPDTSSTGLWRQALGLLALVSAYLAYYHTDVQLEILTLTRVLALLSP